MFRSAANSSSKSLSDSLNTVLYLTIRVPALLTLLLLAACGDNQIADEPLQQSQTTYFFAATVMLSESQQSPQQISFERSLLPADGNAVIWQLDSYDIPSYRPTGLHLHHHLKITTDPDIVVHRDQTLTLYSPAIAYPLAVTRASHALWLLISPSPSTGTSLWMAPSFTPDIAEQAQQETLERARLTESMADDAYFFGYSSNDDALE